MPLQVLTNEEWTKIMIIVSKTFKRLQKVTASDVGLTLQIIDDIIGAIDCAYESAYEE